MHRYMRQYNKYWSRTIASEGANFLKSDPLMTQIECSCKYSLPVQSVLKVE